MRYFFIEQPIVGGPPCLITGSDARHIKTVLRLRTGDKIGLFDGKGFEYEAKITAISSRSIKVTVLGGARSSAESAVQIIVGQAFLKERKMDILVRQLTELGISKWIPFFAQRSVPRPDPKNLSARKQRWEKIAKEALKQCRRARVPEIGETVSYKEILDQSRDCDLKIAFWEEESSPINVTLPKQKKQIEKIFVLLGPEGGFTVQEMETATALGFITASLGPRILKAETATVAACVLLQYLYGDMGKRS